ncbi:MAG: hypothetical protein GYA17_07610 [Chloroflexi bacterium]|jgi:hypothetical protein|nr:hypothetical protein [Chloroflexota bacterium]
MLNKVTSAAGSLLGQQNNLQKATLVVKETHETIPCQFNPQELSLTRSVSWEGAETPFLNSPTMQFRGSPATKCSLKLFFDTTDSGDDVRAYTNQLLRLTLKSGGGTGKGDVFASPPTVKFIWGKFQLFSAVITHLSIAYILFLADGTPVRARADVTFTQHDHDDDPKGAQNPTTRTEPRRTRVVQAGERLDNIAYEEYGHPRFWRRLAEANDIDHVESLVVGQTLIIPPLD